MNNSKKPTNKESKEETTRDHFQEVLKAEANVISAKLNLTIAEKELISLHNKSLQENNQALSENAILAQSC